MDYQEGAIPSPVRSITPELPFRLTINDLMTNDLFNDGEANELFLMTFSMTMILMTNLCINKKKPPHLRSDSYNYINNNQLLFEASFNCSNLICQFFRKMCPKGSILIAYKIKFVFPLTFVNSKQLSHVFFNAV